jgi:hypothetical protein
VLEQTFCHIPGFGRRTEERLWSAGVTDWHSVLANPHLPCLGARAELARKHVAEAKGHLERGNAHFFTDALPSREHWRMFPHFRPNVVYVDIETTGANPAIDYITTVCTYDGNEMRYYLHGANLDELVDDLRRYDLLVTYNGKSFDLPFIRKYLGRDVRAAHVDLRHVLASLGFSGGLKGCERSLGICRDELDGVDGYFAVLLWYDFFNGGNRNALETLLAYNMMDVVNLERLMVTAYNMKLEATPFAHSLRLDSPPPPQLPFKAHEPTINRLRRRLQYP